MVIFSKIMLLLALATFSVLICMVGIDYRVTRSHLTITFWGIPIRWMKLSTIVSVSKRRRFTAEQWVSTFRMKHRRASDKIPENITSTTATKEKHAS